MSGPHYSGSAYVRGESGAAQRRTASLRLRLEPALLEALKLRADALRDRWPDGRGAGASAHVRAVLIADLVAAGILERDGGSVRVVSATCGHTSTAVAGEGPRRSSAKD